MASITQRGAAWRGRVRIAGQILTKTFDTETDAKVWAAAEEARILSGETAAQIRQMPSNILMGELLDRYAREVSPTKGGGRWEQIRLNALAPSFPGRAIDIDGAMLAEWRDKRLRMVSAGSVNRELNLISAVFTRAIKEWRLPLTVNPVRTIMWPRNPHPRRRRVSDEERAAVLKALGWEIDAPRIDTLHRFVAWAFLLALETMMRQGEILRLTWRHVHLDRRFCHLPKTKNGHPRNVPLSSRALALFEMLEVSGPDNNVVPVDQGTFGVYFRRAVASAGIKDLHFHDTRREALTRAAAKITNVAELARASGHRGISSLMVYFEPDVEEIAKKLD